MTDELSLEEQARQFIEQKPYRLEQWESGSPLQQMLARATKKIAGVE
ncbi:hypothetical protein [Methanolobus sp.]|jgi:hypothetical protein|nr:hypothetical protein [Methanolobus sp.]